MYTSTINVYRKIKTILSCYYYIPVDINILDWSHDLYIVYDGWWMMLQSTDVGVTDHWLVVNRPHRDPIFDWHVAL